jgi:AcrR family transcriptional regulator
MPPDQKPHETETRPPAKPERKMSAHDRLLAAGKTLFAENGYEATSTSSIASEAGTSESQLVRYFGGKAGLLEAIFNAGWGRLNQSIGSKVISASTGREAILVVLQTMSDAFHSDRELAKIFLFEGRRIRGAEHEVFISEGFVRFRELLHKLIKRGLADGSFKKKLPEAVVVSALIGCAEGMIRDRIVAEDSGRLEDFSTGDIAKTVSAILEGL